MFCLIFEQISKKLSNRSWFAAGLSFFNKVIHHFGGLFRRAIQLHNSLTINWRVEGLWTIEERKKQTAWNKPNSIDVPFWGSRAVSPLSISDISGIRANTSSEPWAAPGMPRDLAGLARTASADGTQLKAMLAPYPSEEMTCWPVSPRVGNVKNNDPSLVEPIAGVG
jgi:hypothetical protein